jgi:molybdopterin synthase sulfur carrier subunit
MAEKTVRVQIPASLRRLTGGVTEAVVSGATLREVIEGLEERFPTIRERLCEGERLRPGLAVAINSKISSTGLFTPVPAGAEVNFLPALAGG